MKKDLATKAIHSQELVIWYCILKQSECESTMCRINRINLHEDIWTCICIESKAIINSKVLYCIVLYVGDHCPLIGCTAWWFVSSAVDKLQIALELQQMQALPNNDSWHTVLSTRSEIAKCQGAYCDISFQSLNLF